MYNRIVKPHPVVGTKVAWVKGDENFHLRDEISNLCDIYGEEGLTILQVWKQGRRGYSVALNKWGAPVLEPGTSNIRSFSWHLLTPILN